VPLTYLAETVAAWNRYVDAGADPDFEREKDGPMHPIATPPFYALSIMVVWHDSYGGLRVNGRQQVIDMQGEVIPGLYAGGEAAGGFDKHGLGKGTVQGYIAGTHAEPRDIRRVMWSPSRTRARSRPLGQVQLVGILDHVETEVRERFERIEAILEAVARRQDRFDKQLQAAAARQDRFDKQLHAAAARQDRFDKQLKVTAKLVAEGIKIVRTLARDTRELKRSQKAFLDSLRHGGNGRGPGRG
jgi:succinate dehydrogenase/fumarate reductase flavoprotein subunit